MNRVNGNSILTPRNHSISSNASDGESGSRKIKEVHLEGCTLSPKDLNRMINNISDYYNDICNQDRSNIKRDVIQNLESEFNSNIMGDFCASVRQIFQDKYNSVAIVFPNLHLKKIGHDGYTDSLSGEKSVEIHAKINSGQNLPIDQKQDEALIDLKTFISTFIDNYTCLQARL